MDMKKPVCNLVGQNGNVFSLMGVVKRTLRQHGLEEQAEEMSGRILAGEAQSYSQALAIFMEYVDIM